MSIASIDTAGADMYAEDNDTTVNEPRERDFDSGGRTADLSSIYLRDTGATPLLSKEDETRLATQLNEARDALVQVFLSLPTGCREYVLEEIDETLHDINNKSILIEPKPLSR